jgi:SAM-dependent methyltransferase
VTTPTHDSLQRQWSDGVFADGSRSHLLTDDALVQYLVRWRLSSAMTRLRRVAPDLDEHSSILVLCSGDGFEGSHLADLGYRDVTVSDLSVFGVRSALERDPRLRGVVLNATTPGVRDRSVDVVIVQDGLHHLVSPVAGFVEMLRICRRAAVFLEPHDSFAGRRAGTTWEVNGDAVNYVFRWNRQLVDQVANSYLGPDSCVNHSFSFWHHNVHLDRLGRRLGGGHRAVRVIDTLKRTGDRVLPRSGNQFCGTIVKLR